MAITERELQISNKSYTNKDFAEVYTELLEYAEKLSKRFSPTHSNESDPFVVLLKLVAFVTDKINYNVDKNILEAFMGSCTQEKSMRELCDMLGYSMHYYEAASTDVIFKYNFTGDDDPGSISIPRFSTVSDGNSIQYVTIESADITKNTGQSQATMVLQGKRKELQILGDSNIQLENLDNNKLYFPELYVAQNGVFVTNVSDTEEWECVTNLNTQQYGSKVYKFAFDKAINQPYLEFPEWINDIIGSGLHIDYIVTEGSSGNIGVKELIKVTRLTTDDKVRDEDIVVVNSSAANNGKDIETIAEAYEGFKKTIGTFDTLVTCRDYANYIYQNLEEYASNVQVSDRRTDINYALNLVESTTLGATVKPESRENKTISASDLCLYALKPLTNTNWSGLSYRDAANNEKFIIGGYDDAYRHSQENSLIAARLEEAQTMSHDYKTFSDDGNKDILFIKDNYILDMVISTSYKVNTLEQLDIKYNIKNALIREFNSRTLDWGEEIPFSSLIEVIMKADSRITNVSLMQPDHELEFVTYDSNSEDAENRSRSGDDYNFCINYVVAKNILEGRASLYEYDEDFDYNFDEKNGEKTINVKEFTSACNLESLEINANGNGSITLNTNEVIQILGPKLITGNGIYPFGVNYYFNSGNAGTRAISKGSDYALQSGDYLALFYQEENGDRVVELYCDRKYIMAREAAGSVSGTVQLVSNNIFTPNFKLENTSSATYTSLSVDNTSPYKAAWEYAFNQLGIPRPQTFVANNLEQDQEIRHKVFNEEIIKQTKRCYWYMNNVDNKINWGDEGGAPRSDGYYYYNYVLQDGEYFFYSDIAMTELYSYGAGTSLQIKSKEKISADDWVISDTKAVDEITSEGLESLTTVFVIKNFKEDFALVIRLNEIITLTAGDKIEFINDGTTTANISIKNNVYSDYAGAAIKDITVKYYLNGSTTDVILPDRSTLNSDYIWKMRAILDLNTGSDLPQELINNQSITFTYADPGLESKQLTNCYFKLSTPAQLGGGTNVSLAYYDIDSKLKYPALYTYELKSLSTTEDYAVNQLDDCYVITFQDKQSASLELYMPHGSYFNVCRSDAVANVTISCTNVEGVFVDLSDAEVIDKKTLNLNTEDNILLELVAGKNHVTLEVSSNDGGSIKGVRLYVYKPKVVIGLNPLLGDVTFESVSKVSGTLEDKFKAFVKEYYGETVLKKFYATAPIAPEKMIQLSFNCKLNDPRAFLDYNNVANRWTIGKIDFEKSNFEIAANCKATR